LKHSEGPQQNSSGYANWERRLPSKRRRYRNAAPGAITPIVLDSVFVNQINQFGPGMRERKWDIESVLEQQK
jgi:hypothetical protein